MPVKIFFCYAHEDEQLLKKLKSHLIPLQRQGLIDVWHDRDISAGTDWGQRIKEQLNDAQIILLLVSPDFMVSDYCYGIEMQRVSFQSFFAMCTGKVCWANYKLFSSLTGTIYPISFTNTSSDEPSR